MTVEEFRSRIMTSSPEEIVDQVLLGNTPKHVTEANRDFIKKSVAAMYAVPQEEIEVWIVGSANLGFSISEKRKKDRIFPRYRQFSPYSDVDAAIVAPKVFRLIWDNLCKFSHTHSYWPWKANRLGDYLLCGWLRPDHFPLGVRLRRCDDWNDTFRRLSANARFSRRAVTGALYHSLDDLKRYQIRAVRECVKFEEEKNENSSNQ